VIDIVPLEHSGERGQDSEPTLAVNPSDPNHRPQTLQMVATAFTFDNDDEQRMHTGLAPLYTSKDGGATWIEQMVLPSVVGSNMPEADVTAAFSASGKYVYVAMLAFDPSPPFNGAPYMLRVLRSDKLFTTPHEEVMPTLYYRTTDDQHREDQPYVEATTYQGTDRVFVGQILGQPAIDFSLDPISNPLAGFSATPYNLDPRLPNPPPWNSPEVRPAVKLSNGNVYIAYYGVRQFREFSADEGSGVADVVVAKSDHNVAAAEPFSQLMDPNDHLRGVVAAPSIPFYYSQWKQDGFGDERVGGDLAIAVDPRPTSQKIYVAYASGKNNEDYSLNLIRSDNDGLTWSAVSQEPIIRGKNASLAVNTEGDVGFLYQQFANTKNGPRWETHYERAKEDFKQPVNRILASMPTIGHVIDPLLGDYAHLQSVGTNFYGIFSSLNTPDPANFPEGVEFQRKMNNGRRPSKTKPNVLQDASGAAVPSSIDPFFFSDVPDEPAPAAAMKSKLGPQQKRSPRAAAGGKGL
jgi:hypothetical protein